MIWDWMAAEDALEVAIRYVDANPDTLLIAVPDHDTGGGVTYGIGSGYRHSTEALETLHRRRASLEWFLRDGLPGNPDSSTVAAAAEEYLGIPLSERRADQIAAVLNGQNPDDWDWGHPNAQGSRNNRIGHLLSISDEGPRSNGRTSTSPPARIRAVSFPSCSTAQELPRATWASSTTRICFGS